jgi:hypothetical protein
MGRPSFQLLRERPWSAAKIAFVALPVAAAAILAVGWFAFGSNEAERAGVIRPADPVRPRNPAKAVAAPGSSTPQAAEPAAPVQREHGWTRTVHYETHVRRADLAIGELDGLSAEIGDRGALTFHLPTGLDLRADGTARAELHVHVKDHSTGPYHVQVAMDHDERFVTVAHGLDDSRRIDLDAQRVEGARYVRITAASGSRVFLDAVELLYLTPAQ